MSDRQWAWWRVSFGITVPMPDWFYPRFKRFWCQRGGFVYEATRRLR